MEHHPQSLLCAGVKPNEHLTSSRTIEWRSLLVGHHQGARQRDLFETHPTPDVTVVTGVRGRHRVEVFSSGQWRLATTAPAQQA